MLIRSLGPGDDRLALSRIYEEGWRRAYRGIVPQEYLDAIPTGRWAPFFDAPGIHLSLIHISGISCRAAGILGGVVLCAIGLKLLFEGIGVL